MELKRYSIIIPIFISMLFFASLAGIIGNALTLGRSTNRSFYISNLQPGEISESIMTIPDTVGRAEIDIIVNQENNPDVDKVNIYLAENSKPASISTIEDLESSIYFSEDIILFERTVNNEAIFYPPQEYDQIYIIWGNPESSDITFSVDITLRSADTATGQSAVKIIAIIFASIFTALFFGLALYLWFEIFAVNWYDPKLLTKSLDQRIEGLFSKAESWEIVLTIVAAIGLVWGYGSWLIGGNTFSFFISIMLGLFAYYSFSTRQKRVSSIRAVLMNNNTMSLSNLARSINEDEEDTKKAVLDMILYDKFPATYDFENEIIKFDPDANPNVIPPKRGSIREATFEIPREEVVSNSVEEDNKPQRSLPQCAYCGEEAITVDSQFCHSCGASMASAK